MTAYLLVIRNAASGSKGRTVRGFTPPSPSGPASVILGRTTSLVFPPARAGLDRRRREPIEFGEQSITPNAAAGAILDIEQDYSAPPAAAPTPRALPFAMEERRHPR
jgi:hypothetical protein